jgi:hypothetical protein
MHLVDGGCVNPKPLLSNYLKDRLESEGFAGVSNLVIFIHDATF